MVPNATCGEVRRDRQFFSLIELELKEAIRVFVRYEQPDERGITRRDRNESFRQPAPEFIIPDGGEYLWNWYHEISDSLRRVNDGVCFPIPWTEYIAWAQVTRQIVNSEEYAILRSIDVDFCDEMNKELEAYRERENERQRAAILAAQAAAAKGAPRGRSS